MAAAAALLKYVEFIQNVTFASNSLMVVFKGSEKTTMIGEDTSKQNVKFGKCLEMLTFYKCYIDRCYNSKTTGVGTEPEESQE